MADQHQLDILRQGQDVWNTWRWKHPTTTRPDLSGADLSEADLSGTDLNNADLSEADLIGANLGSANLSAAHLSGANLSGADFSVAHLNNADLNNADLTSADLTSADLSEADLSEADLSSATVGWTQFDSIDLRTVRGLETVEPQGPSSIGIDTIYRSEGHIPEVFLRKAGVPEDFLAYMRSLITRPIEYQTCFITHSRRDQEFADRL